MKAFIRLSLAISIVLCLTSCRFKLVDGHLVREDSHPQIEDLSQTDTESDTGHNDVQDNPELNQIQPISDFLPSNPTAELDLAEENTDSDSKPVETNSDSDNSIPNNNLHPEPELNDTDKTPAHRKQGEEKPLVKISQTIEFARDPSNPSAIAIKSALENKKFGQECYKRIIDKQGYIYGKLTVTVIASKDGTIMKVEKINDEIGGELYTCIKQRIYNLTLGQLENPTAFKITWTFEK